MRKKAIKAEYRKNSESFPEWIKYEVTILHEDGKIEKVPAYGKDLQDALSRVVHDDKVEKIQTKTESIPWWVWSIIFMVYMSTISIWSTNSGKSSIMIIGLLAMISIVFGLNSILIKKNIDKEI
jgi:hypothetical protein